VTEGIFYFLIVCMYVHVYSLNDGINNNSTIKQYRLVWYVYIVCIVVSCSVSKSCYMLGTGNEVSLVSLAWLGK